VTGAAFDELVAIHKAGWLADAAALCRVLDPPGTDRAIHVVDAATLPEEARRHALAWTAGGLDGLLRDRLRDRRRGPVLVIDAGEIVRRRLEPAALTEHEVAVLGRLEVAQVAIHELGHARLAEATGSALPATATLPALLAAVGTPTSDDHHRGTHGQQWVRSYLVLSSRAARWHWPQQWWIDAAVADVRRHVEIEATADELLAALQPELDTDEPLISILRRPPPAAFSTLFDPPA
jgi:hypothetical protein